MIYKIFLKNPLNGLPPDKSKPDFTVEAEHVDDRAGFVLFVKNHTEEVFRVAASEVLAIEAQP